MATPVTGAMQNPALASLLTAPTAFSPAAVTNISGFINSPLDSQLALSTQFNPLQTNNDFFQMMNNLMAPLKSTAATSLQQLQALQLQQQQQALASVQQTQLAQNQQLAQLQQQALLQQQQAQNPLGAGGGDLQGLATALQQAIGQLKTQFGV